MHDLDTERPRAECDRLMDFAAASAHPDGGFAWLGDDGTPQLDRPVQAWISCRMTHVFALGHLLGRPGAAALVDHGVAALRGRLRDERDGGWFAAVGGGGTGVGGTGVGGTAVGDKRAYEHAFVVLAASSAAAAGRPGADALLADALAVVERFWDEDAGMVVDVWDRTWTTLEPYRGVNANMHMVEAFLAAADVSGNRLWRERAARIVQRVVHGFAREHRWRLPEHYDPAWQPLPEYHRDEPAHPFRPFGVTVGHLLEWARLALHLRAALGDAAPRWLLDDAVALFDAAVRDGWAADGVDGFVYTVDFDGVPVVRDRLHWVLAEAIAAAAALHAVTGEDRFLTWYERWWAHADRYVIDRERGSWRHQLDARLAPASSVWDGKPDVYHAVQATLVPRLPLAPTMATALRREDVRP